MIANLFKNNLSFLVLNFSYLKKSYFFLGKQKQKPKIAEIYCEKKKSPIVPPPKENHCK